MIARKSAQSRTGFQCHPLTSEVASRRPDESKALGKVCPAPDAMVDRMRAAVAAGAQTRHGERELEAFLDRFR
ncbi:hypothetical protein [Nonomuraea sp. NPDC003727]